ncbi:MAG: hypothetical protein ACODAJ_14305 [Planctomycetota bacterium]
MAKKTTKNTTKQKNDEEPCAELRCPIYEMMQCLCGKDTVGSRVLEHLENAHKEVLLGIREVIDARIEELDKDKPASSGKARRIKVTEKD